MACLLAGTSDTKSLVLFGGWRAACRLDCYEIHMCTPVYTGVKTPFPNHRTKKTRYSEKQTLEDTRCRTWQSA
jgi:hypothetical protein